MHEETFRGILPGSGPVAVTATVRNITPGEWTVTARPVTRAGGRPLPLHTPARDGMAGADKSELWPRRLTIPAGSMSQITTAIMPFAKLPGITRFAWTALVVLGVLAGLAVQAALLARAHLPIGAALAVSAGAVVAGVAGAKAWYIAVHRGSRFDGWCIQGFVAGAAAAVGIALPVSALGMPAGTYLNAAAPGLMLGMAIGRPGCFWAGCCTGRPTASRWGIWSSDQRVGARRIPAQLLEALLALAIGLAALLTVLVTGPGGPATVAVAAVAAYTLGRQFILGLRAEPPRRTRLSGPVTAAAAAAVLIADIVAGILL